ncbi:FAD-dependent oxidoreductase [Rugamonas sp.]|uniref:FAD-dependent oxidoreductase n=1 Tax=Rugamonas sp. TaxID=1926287 RepID=UPI00345C4140
MPNSEVPQTPNEHEDGHGPTTVADFARRAHQMYFALTAAEIKRLERFGQVMRWPDGSRIYVAGESSYAMLIVLKGKIAMSRDDGMGRSSLIVEYGPGQFTGEVAQLTNRPSLAHGDARGEFEAIAINSESLRRIVVAEAELGERIMRALILRRLKLIQANGSGPALIGPAEAPAMIDLQNFLSSNGHPYTVRDPLLDAQAAALVARLRPKPADWPLVVCPDGSVKIRPSMVEMGRCLGLLPELDAAFVYDILVVGAGPAGLAAAVYAASEGLSVLVLEQRAYGGQAGASARIENYLGFPTGISGRALAGRAYVQAHKFGADVAIPARVANLHCDEFPLRLALDDGSALHARSVVLACGAQYKRPPLANLAQFEGRGVYYWASSIEARLCKSEEIVLVGGGNSAGQAAVYLSTHAGTVRMLIRGAGLAATMSSYLVERIAATPNIVLHTHTELAQLDGEGECLARVTWKNNLSGESTTAHIRNVFLFIGAEPNTRWLDACGICVDEHHFIRTGSDVMQDPCGDTPHYSAYMPRRAALETSVPGVFAIGDVRANSTKRVAGAVGEGAAVVSQIHAYLAYIPAAKRLPS